MRAKIDLRVADTSDDKPLKPDEQAEFCTPRARMTRPPSIRPRLIRLTPSRALFALGAPHETSPTASLTERQLCRRSVLLCILFHRNLAHYPTRQGPKEGTCLTLRSRP